MKGYVDLKRSLFGSSKLLQCKCLTAKAVEGASLTFEGIHHIHGSDGLPLGMLGVGDGITDDVLKEDLEDTTGLFVDEARDTLDTSSAGQTTDGWLGDALDIITQHLAVTLSASLSEPLASFTTSSHLEQCCANAEKFFSPVVYMVAASATV